MPHSNAPNLKENLLRLGELASMEASLFSIKHQLEEIPQNLKEMESRLTSLQSQLQEKTNKVQTFEQEYRQKEFELTDSKEKTKAREARLFEIKTTKEYQAAIKEVAAGKKQNQETEAFLLQRMGEIENLKKEIAPFEEEMTTLSAKVAEEKGRISGELEGLQKQLEEKVATKQQLFSTLDASLVSHYERILVRRQPAVAQVRSGSCQECNMNVPPQLFIELQKYREVIHCPSCHRILYIPA